MPLWFRNFQNRILFNEHLLKMQCHFLMSAFGVSHFDINVVCISNSQIRHLNKVYRKVDEVTDVLSFPFHEGLLPGVVPSFTNSHDYNLGDITLGLPYIGRQCQHDNTILEHHLPVVLTHGICHLMGYEHDNSVSAKQMHFKEMSVLTQFNNTFGTDIKPLTTFE